MALVDDIQARAGLSRSTGEPGGGADLVALRDRWLPSLRDMLGGEVPMHVRADLAGEVGRGVAALAEADGIVLNALQRRNLVTALVNALLRDRGGSASGAAEGAREPIAQGIADLLQSSEPNPAAAESGGAGQAGHGARSANRRSVEEAVQRLRPLLMEQIDIAAAAKLARAQLAEEISALMPDLLRSAGVQLNGLEQRDLVTVFVNDMLGLGPLEPLLADPAINDILVNGASQIYVERKGKLELTDAVFRDDRHVMAVCTRIVSRIGRRVDESQPMCDARLADGSRVNIIIPPLAIDGPSISIRKFSEKKITLEVMSRQGNISTAMERVLMIAARARLNILISGGTGSGKTTLLNALSRMIDQGERIVTIEDAAELQLQQPHVVRLETRPANLEGSGEITMRHLVKNALRMRPDRIILGEVRGSEAVDMLQAMNTGHEGSMCTIHANNPREALTRMENMIGMAGINLPAKAVRTQVASAIDLIVQISRMRDGIRRIVSVTEVVGMEGDIITTQELFRYRYKGEDNAGRLLGDFECAGLRPHFLEKAAYFGLDKPLLEAVAGAAA